jgi:hypothetical protein
MCWSNHDFFDGLNPDCWRPESLSQWHALLKEQYIYTFIFIYLRLELEIAEIGRIPSEIQLFLMA